MPTHPSRFFKEGPPAQKSQVAKVLAILEQKKLDAYTTKGSKLFATTVVATAAMYYLSSVCDFGSFAQALSTITTFFTVGTANMYSTIKDGLSGFNTLTQQLNGFSTELQKLLSDSLSQKEISELCAYYTSELVKIDAQDNLFNHPGLFDQNIFTPLLVYRTNNLKQEITSLKAAEKPLTTDCVKVAITKTIAAGDKMFLQFTGHVPVDEEMNTSQTVAPLT